MNKIDALLDLLDKIYQILKYYQDTQQNFVRAVSEQRLTRQEVKDYLGISESTYKRKVREGKLKPMKYPGGDRFLKTELDEEFNESKRRGRI